LLDEDVELGAVGLLDALAAWETNGFMAVIDDIFSLLLGLLHVNTESSDAPKTSHFVRRDL
jgi:hypothetical protein